MFLLQGGENKIVLVTGWENKIVDCSCYRVGKIRLFLLQGGENGGSCAGGFGVCCYFLAECGGTYSQNLTYWQKTSTTPCSINICKCQSDVCFIRLDFTSFDLHQPDSDLSPTTTLAGQCVEDMLTVASPGAPPAPPLCGTNTGYHMYVELQGTNCAQLTITQGTVTANREWDITISQIVCPGM